MSFGLSPEGLVFLHVVISLVGIMTGLIVVAIMLQNGDLAGWNAFFLASTILTSVTGFPIPAKAILLSHVLGAVSLVALVVALVALYGRKFAGPWRAAYVVSALFALYLNCFVALAQSFGNVAFLRDRALAGSALPFILAQALVLLAFLVAGVLALRRFRPLAKRP
jgi:hypothetical protein